MCSGFVLEPFGHRQGGRGKASSVSIDRVGGPVRTGGGADRGWHQQLCWALVTQGTAFVMKEDSLQGAGEGKDQMLGTSE